MSYSKNLFFGRGSPRCSRSVVPSYSFLNSPLRCSSGTNRSATSFNPCGRNGITTVNPSQPPSSSHVPISSAILSGVPTNARPEYPPSRCASCLTVNPSAFASLSTLSLAVCEAFVAGISSGSGPSGSKPDASVPNAIDREAIPES